MPLIPVQAQFGSPFPRVAAAGPRAPSPAELLFGLQGGNQQQGDLALILALLQMVGRDSDRQSNVAGRSEDRIFLGAQNTLDRNAADRRAKEQETIAKRRFDLSQGQVANQKLKFENEGTLLTSQAAAVTANTGFQKDLIKRQNLAEQVELERAKGEATLRVTEEEQGLDLTGLGLELRSEFGRGPRLAEDQFTNIMRLRDSIPFGGSLSSEHTVALNRTLPRIESSAPSAGPVKRSDGRPLVRAFDEFTARSEGRTTAEETLEARIKRFVNASRSPEDRIGRATAADEMLRGLRDRINSTQRGFFDSGITNELVKRTDRLRQNLRKDFGADIQPDFASTIDLKVLDAKRADFKERRRIQRDFQSRVDRIRANGQRSATTQPTTRPTVPSGLDEFQELIDLDVEQRINRFGPQPLFE